MIDKSFKINLAQVYNAEVGFKDKFQVTGYFKSNEDIIFLEPVSIDAVITKLDDGLLAEGRIKSIIELICHRCAKNFKKKIDINFSGYLSENPEDEYVINDDLEFDFEQIVRDEILLSLPIKIVCSENCKGIKIVE